MSEKLLLLLSTRKLLKISIFYNLDLRYNLTEVAVGEKIF